MPARTHKYESFFHELYEHLGHEVIIKPDVDQRTGEVMATSVFCCECDRDLVSYDNDGDLPTHLSTTRLI